MIRENYSLITHNSFNLDVTAKFFLEAESQQELVGYIKREDINAIPFLIIGEGSNLLFIKDFNGLIIHPAIKGFKIIKETKNEVLINVGAGENWDEFVKYAVNNSLGGIENLSLIPGSVGASPVQNIGAYGVEVKNNIVEVNGIDLADNTLMTLSKDDCAFDYRTSIFKKELKNRFIITSVTFSLSKNPQFELSYGPVKQKFMGKKEQNLESLRQTIIEIRQSKLPDPKVYGNAGSFFKNPIINIKKFEKLMLENPSIPSYPAGDNLVKIPAAWLIEKAGWKGKREGNTGSFPSQPLVIVNYGGATGMEILDFSLKIQKSVMELFDIELEREVNIVGTSYMMS